MMKSCRMPINKTKQYSRRCDGEVFTILTVNAPCALYPVIGMDTHGIPYRYDPFGRFLVHETNGDDLLEMPITAWVGLKRVPGSPTGYIAWSTQRNQSEAQGGDVVVPITFRDGDGLLP